VLDDHIGHELSVSVSLLVQPMHLVHVDLVKLNLAIVSSSEDGLVGWVHRSRPNPVLHLSHCSEEHSFSVPQCDLLVAAGHGHIVAFWKEGYRAWVKAKLLLVADRFGLLASLD